MSGRPLRTQSVRYPWHGELVTAKSNGDLALAASVAEPVSGDVRIASLQRVTTRCAVDPGVRGNKGSSRNTRIGAPVARSRSRSRAWELLQHPADHPAWLSDSQWPARRLRPRGHRSFARRDRRRAGTLPLGVRRIEASRPIGVCRPKGCLQCAGLAPQPQVVSHPPERGTDQ
jgi:hypothetical protein